MARRGLLDDDQAQQGYNSYRKMPIRLQSVQIDKALHVAITTGMPKGVSRNHGGVVLTVRGYIQQSGVRSDDVLMSVLTLGHANAQVMALFTAIGRFCPLCIVVFKNFNTIL